MRAKVLVRGVLGAAVLFLVVAALAGPASAQRVEPPRHRQGYYVALSGSASTMIFDDDGDTTGVLVGGGGWLRAGQMLTRCHGLGFRLGGVSASGDGLDAFAGGLLVEGQYNLAGELTLHAGVGFGFSSLTGGAQDGVPLDDRGGYGPLWTVDLTYDWFMTDRTTGGWALTPTVSLWVLPGGAVDAASLSVGLQLTWWSGRPRRELALPEEDSY